MRKIVLFILGAMLTYSTHAQTGNKPSKKTNHQKQIKMENKDFTSTIMVDKNALQASEAIKNFRGWWSEDIEGETDKVGATFFYHYQDVHLCRIRFVEEIPGKKLVYQVLDNEFSFTKDKTEWVDTRLIFELSVEGNQTRITFTHQGLVPEYECYNVCHDAWTGFIQKSLKEYINTGKGQPNPKDGTNQINAENIEKWKIKSAQKDNSYTFNFETSRSAEEVFTILSDPHKWWMGIYDEHVAGNYRSAGDTFSYRAGNGMHYSVQKVTELIPGKKIVWFITESNLSFLEQKDEWTGTSIVMTITANGDKTHVTFKHQGLLPAIECYGACSSAWSQYMNNLKKALN